MEVSVSQMGESGHLQSNAVQRKLPAPRNEVSVVAVPDEAQLETPFPLTCLVSNTSSKQLQLQVRARSRLARRTAPPCRLPAPAPCPRPPHSARASPHAFWRARSAPRASQLRFPPSGSGGIVIDGVSGRSLGTLKPHSSQQVTLTFIALEPGMQKVSGLQLFDAVSETLHEVGPLADVFVRLPA